ncbi:hypothetical protein WA158_001113 [Blastocystis sp. Blastoise]
MFGSLLKTGFSRLSKVSMSKVGSTFTRSLFRNTMNNGSAAKKSNLAFNVGLGLLGAGCFATGVFALAPEQSEEKNLKYTKENYLYTGSLAEDRKDKIRVFSGNSNKPLAKAICKYLGIQESAANVGRFNDGEIDIHIDCNIRGKHVYIVQSTAPPASDNLMELLLLISTCRRASAEKITAIMPYYGYGRVNSNDRNNEALLSGADVSEMLMSMGVDNIVAIDLYREQSQGFFTASVPLDNVQVSHLFAAYLMENETLHEPVIISPTAHGVTRAKFFRNALTTLKCTDSTMALAIHIKEEKQKTEVTNSGEKEDDEASDEINIPMNKQATPTPTTSPSKVTEDSPYEIIGDVKDKDVIIVDNMIISGNTLVGVSKKLMKEGARRVIAIATHGLYVDNAVEKLKDAPIERIITTNTVADQPKEKECPKMERLNIAPLLAEVIVRHELNQPTLDLNNLNKWNEKRQAAATTATCTKQEQQKSA